MEKICATCGIQKPSTEFYKDARKNDGLRNTCKKCSVWDKNYKQNISNILEKICIVCKELKPLEGFLRDDRTTLGYSTKCLACSQIKLCRKCQTKKPLEDFGISNKSTDGRRYSCRECENRQIRENYVKDPSSRRSSSANYYYKKESREGRRERMLMKNYNLTLEDYDSLLEAQDYKCAICRYEAGKRGRPLLAVDHCHDTGKVRGLLCDPCNRAIGMLLHDPVVIQNALNYIQSESALHAYYG